MGRPFPGRCFYKNALLLFLIVVAYRVPTTGGGALKDAVKFRHIPPLDAPTFQRGSVESAPQWTPSDRSSPYIYNSFGSKTLPLRAAVESVPKRTHTRLPLRDAVERRPSPDEPYEFYPDYDQFHNPNWFRVNDVQSPYRYSQPNVHQQPKFHQQTVFRQQPVLQQQPIFQQQSVFRQQPVFQQQPITSYQRTHVLPAYRQFQNLIYKNDINQNASPFRVDNRFQQLIVSPRARSLHSMFRTPIIDYKNEIETQNPSPQRQQQQNYNLICYMESWAVYRKEPLAFTPIELDPFACTHVIYAFATIDFHTYDLISSDYEYDVVRGGYRAVTGLKRKNPNLKILLAIGDAKLDSARKFSNLVAVASRRRDFIRSVVSFITKYGFDGIDLHWQYPGSEELGGHRNDKENLVALLEELSETFKPYGWLISTVAPASRFKAEDGYDIPKLLKTVDFINLLAYDFHTDRPPSADHPSPLLQRDHDKGIDIFYNVDYAVRHWLKRGVPREKLILGVPLFGRSFTLQYRNTTQPGAPIKGPGREGFYTQLAGFLAYYEICDILLGDNWSKNRDSVGSPYVVSRDQWIGYEDKDSIRNKMLYIKELGLGGTAVWAVDLDDFQGLCGEKWPLLNTIRETLQVQSLNEANGEATVPIKPVGTCFSEGLYSDPSDCSAYYICRGGFSYHLACGNNLLFDVKSGQCTYGSAEQCLPGQSVLVKANYKSKSDSKKVVCYVTNWAFYRKGEGKFVPEHLDHRLCTHLIFAFASLDPEQLMIKEFDPWTDIDNNLYERVTSLPDTTVLLALGGWTDSAGDKYSLLVNDGSSRRKFVISTVSFLRRHGFGGLHLDWNYPKCWQSNCRKGPASDKPNFTKLIQELKKEFSKQSPPLILAAAISGYKEVIDVAYDLPALGQALDFMSVMTYDYHGSWEQRTGHVSPLYERPGDKYPQYNTNYTMEYLVNKGAPREKLLVGIPFYGQTFTLARHDGDYSIGAKAAGPGDAGKFTRQPGMLAYYEICYRIKHNKWSSSQDHYKATGPYAYSRDQWVGYEDAASITEKAKYIKNNGFGGAVAWTVDLDDFSNRCCREPFPLLSALARGLGQINTPDPVVGDCTKPPPPATPPPPTLTTGVDTGAISTTAMHEHEQMTTTTRKTTTWPSWTSPTMQPTESTTMTPWWTQSTTKRSTTTRRPTTSYEPSTTERTTTSPRPTSTTQMTWWPTQSTTIPTPAVIMPEVETESPVSIQCEPGQYIPDPQNCNAYYRCVLGEMRKQYCAGGLHWNKNALVCDWPNEANCKENESQPVVAQTDAPEIPTTTKRTTTTRRSTTSRKTTTWSWTTSRRSTTTRKPTTTRRPPTTTRRPASTTKPSEGKGCESGQYYPHENCNSFYVCVNGVLISQQCGPGLQWSQQTSMCDWQHKVKCTKGSASSPAGTYVAGREEVPDGPCEGGNFAAYPGDCSQYLVCLWGKFEAFSCAPGLSWNNARKICDWPDHAQCVDNGGGLTEPANPDPPPTTPKPEYPPSSSSSSKPVIVDNPSVAETMIPTPGSTTSEPTTTPEPKPLSGKYKLVCYFTNWAWYRRGLGKYTPENIDSNLCTHIVYGFAVLDYENLVVKAHDSWADFDNKFYQRVTAYKAKGLKVSLALGGWNDSAGDKYSRLVNNPAARARFIKHVLAFLEKHDFDGLDLDWEYPKCWQVNCDKGPDSDKPAFAEFIREIKTAFRPKGYLLSSAVSPSKTVIDAGYDVPALAENLDWVAVMTYDFHGQWDKQTGHVAPLYYHPDDSVSFFNANFSINYWISEGVPRRKIVMGIPLYGQSFQLENAKNNGLNAKAPGPGQAGEFTRAAGFLAYYEICDRIKNRGWTVVQDKKHRMGPYAYKGNQWVSFDDADMIRRKTEYIRKMKLGGGMIWALDLDDFRNRCGQGVHPLLSVIRNVLAREDKPSEELIEPVIDETPDEMETPEEEKPDSGGFNEPEEKPDSPDGNEEMVDMPKPTEPSTPKPITDPNSEYKMVCYFTNWAWYRQGHGKYLPSNIDPDLCTHIVYGFAVLNGDQLIIKPHDSWADFDNKFYAKVTSYRAKGIKVLIAIGGWNDSAGDKYSRLVNSPSARRRFIAHVVSFIETNNFDGLDLDWEYPKCWQVDCNKGPESDKMAFATFVAELREAFNEKGFLLSSAVSPSKRVVDAGYDVPALSKHLDWIAVMCYDYHGQWDKITGHVAPMYVHPDDTDVTFNTNFTIHYWISQGADRRKIVLGMPLYGQSFSLADNSKNGLNAPTYGGGEAGEETRARGFLAYYEICHNIKKRGWKVVRDRRGRMGPYAYLRDQWVSFDDIKMLQHKSEYIKAMGLGGGMVWALDLDDFRNNCGCEEYPLLRAINRVLRDYPGPQPKCQLESESGDQEEPTTKIPHKKPQNTQFANSKPEKPPSVYTSTMKPDHIPSDPTCGGKIFMAHDTDCNKYYLCNFGQLQLQSCPSGLYWNEDHCDWPENSKCHPDSIPNEEDNETYQTTTEQSNSMITESTVTVIPTNKPSSPGTEIRPDVRGPKVICYFTNWAWYRQGEGKYLPDDIDESLCTHINYGFAVLDSNSLTIKPHDSWADIDNNFYTKVTALKNKGIRVLIAIGGWNDSLGNKYSRLVNDPQARARFITHVLEFIDKWGFDGLDFDWEYPKCWQVDCNKGPDSDKEGFAALISELSAAFKPRGLLLSAAVSPSKAVIDAGYDVPSLSRHFDWIAVMTYDFHGHWDKQTGHVAPLYYYPGDTYDYFNANFSLNYWIEKGAPSEKIIMGIPLYGQSFSLADTSNRGLNAKSYGPGEAGEFTRAGGFLAFYEICERVKRRNWSVTRDPQGRIGPYAYMGNQWVSYDDISEVKRKSKLIKDLNLGGGMIWALDLDDFRNRCGCGKHPLLKTLNNELRGTPLERTMDNCT